MQKVIVKDSGQFEISYEKDQVLLDGEPVEWDIAQIGSGKFHLLYHNRSFEAEVIKADTEKKKFILRINGRDYEVEVKDRFDLLLEKLGMADMVMHKIDEIKAPMPGLVLDVKIEAGTEVQKGDPVLILEAMKMENILKSLGDGTVKEIKVKKGEAVEKNQVLVVMA